MRRTTIEGPLAELAEAYGGVGPLAHACAVSVKTIWRWGHGVEPCAMVQRQVNAMARTKRVAVVFPKQG